MTLRLGCIADDFTGATDLANNLVRAGMRVVQTLGIPAGDVAIDDADAVVIALKSRTAPVQEAVDTSLAACAWLRAQGASLVYFKVCSTFDSTPRGNIGPVAEALADALQAPWVPVTPAFPENGRTVYMGHLFVQQQLLSDSSMRQHPLTPMTDANLVRVLAAQCHTRGVGLIDWPTVQAGTSAVAAAALRALAQQQSLLIVDSIGPHDLGVLAQAVVAQALPLVVAGSGLGAELPAAMGFAHSGHRPAWPAESGRSAIISGSCSAATNAQVAAFIAAGGAAHAIDALQLAQGHDLAQQAVDWALPRLDRGPVLVYATAEPHTVRAVQAQLGAEQAGALVEQTLATVARQLVAAGVQRLVVAGGETSGACVQALKLQRLRVGAQIDPGVPWCQDADSGLWIALKSGNFGAVDFFHKALSAQASGAPHDR